MPADTFFWNHEATDGLRVAELVTFALGSGADARLWRYAMHDADTTLNEVVYRASAITRSSIRRTIETGKTSVTLTVPTSTPIVQDFIARQLGAPIHGQGYNVNGSRTSITIQRAHLNADGSVYDENRVASVFLGVMLGVSIDGAVTTIDCESLQTLFNRQVPVIPILRTCPWALFDYRCGLDPAEFEMLAYPTSQNTVTDPSKPVGLPYLFVTVDGAHDRPMDMSGGGDGVPDLEYFDGGSVHWTETVEGIEIPRWTGIIHADAAGFPNVGLILETPVPNTLPTSVILWPGDQKTSHVCRYRFNNFVHFGGFPALPERNPIIDGVL